MSKTDAYSEAASRRVFTRGYGGRNVGANAGQGQIERRVVYSVALLNQGSERVDGQPDG